MASLAQMLAKRGHDVEVFAALDRTCVEVERSNLIVNYVACSERHLFPALAAEAFEDRHRQNPFDLIEGSEFLAEAHLAAERAPDVALVTKLHTSSAVGHTLQSADIKLSQKARFIAGSLKRLRWPSPYWMPNLESDPELALVRRSDEVTSPCKAMITLTEKVWQTDLKGAIVLPNVFDAPKALQELPIANKGGSVLYVGRLETRKGVIPLAHAIKEATKRDPSINFTLVGRSTQQLQSGRDMMSIMQEIIGRPSDRVRFVGGVPYPELPQYFASADIVVLPSLWENFPNACLEAMVAGKAVIGSKHGGMAEMIEDGRSGELADPAFPKQIAEKILNLAASPNKILEFGEAARERVLTQYSDDAIGPLQESSYLRAIAASNVRAQTGRSANNERGLS